MHIKHPREPPRPTRAVTRPGSQDAAAPTTRTRGKLQATPAAADPAHCLMYRAECEVLGLQGLLPPHVCSQDEQVARVLENFHRLPSALQKYIFMTSLHDRNEVLFFRVVTDNPDLMLPIIYTPTVGLGCQQFGHIYQRPRGMFITANDRGQVLQVLRLHRPGRGPGRHRGQGAAHHRRHVPGRGARAGAAGFARRSGTGQSVPRARPS